MAFSISLGTLAVHLIGDNSGLAKSLRTSEMMLDRTANKMKKVGKNMTKFITVPVALMAAGSIKAFANFDSAMTQSLAIMGNVSAGMRKEMEDTAKLMSTQSVQAASELARSYFFLASAGLNAEQSIAALPVVTRFATAGMFDMSQATDLLTDAQSALGLTVKDSTQNMINMTRISDVLVKANTLANASVEQFSTALTTKAGTAMKSYNIDLEEGVAILAAYADQGIKSQRAGTMFDRMLRLLIKSINSNREVWDRYGIAVETADGNLKPLADILEQVHNRTKDLGAIQKAAALKMLGFEARTQQTILPLLGLSDQIREYEENLKSAGGITDEVSKKQLKSFSAQMRILWNQTKVAGIEIGEILAPAILDMSNKVKEAISWFRGLDEEMKKNTIKFAMIAAAIGPVLLALSAALLAVKAFIAAIVLTPVILLVATLVAGVWALADAFTGGEMGFAKLVRSIKVGGHDIGTWVDLMISHIEEGWEIMLFNMTKGWVKLQNKIKQMGSEVKTVAIAWGQSFKVALGGNAMKALKVISNRMRMEIVEKTKMEKEHQSILKGLGLARKAREKKWAAERTKILADELAREIKAKERAALAAAQRQAGVPGTTSNTFGVLASQGQGENELTMYESFLNNKLAMEQAYVGNSVEIEKAHSAETLAIIKNSVDQQVALEKQKKETILMGTASLFGLMAAIAQTGGKKAFNTYKAFAIAEAAMSTYLAFDKALAGGPGPPATIPLASAVLGMGLLKVRQIAMQKPGGSVSGGSGGTASFSSTPTNVTPPDELTSAEDRDEMIRQRPTIIIENIHGTADDAFADSLADRIMDRSIDGRNFGFATESR